MLRIIATLQSLGVDKYYNRYPQIAIHDICRRTRLVNTLSLLFISICIIISICIELTFSCDVLLVLASSAVYTIPLLLNYLKLHTAAACFLLLEVNLRVTFFALFCPNGTLDMIWTVCAMMSLAIFEKNSWLSITGLFLPFFMKVLSNNLETILLFLDFPVFPLNEVPWLPWMIHLVVTLLIWAFRYESDSVVASCRAQHQEHVEFWDVMTHEIRTPLNGLLGMLELLQKESTEFPFSHREMLQVMQISGKILLRTVNDTLDFSKLRVSKLQLDLKPMQLQSLVDSISSIFSPIATAKGLDFVLKCDAPKQSLIADEFRIHQIFANLIYNALKHTQQGFIEVGIRPIDNPNQSVELLCYVKDTGQGIPKLHLNKLFQRFEQVQCSENSSGLGLFICKSLCELMNGKISIHTEPNRGTTFYFSILCQRTLPPTIPKYLPTSAEYHSDNSLFLPEELLDKIASDLRILVAEDNEFNQKVIKKILNRIGITRITLVGNGEEAVQKFTEGEFDLVLLDQIMPIKNGLEVARNIREFETKMCKQPVYIIALTATVSANVRENSILAGMNAFLNKPILIEDFRKAFKQFVLLSHKTC